MTVLILNDEDRARYAEVSAEVLARGSAPVGLVEAARERKRVKHVGRPPARTDPPPLTPEDVRFAELIFETHDAWSVVSEADAARVAGVTPSAARARMARLAAHKAWPYRPADWRDLMDRGWTFGPFAGRTAG